MNPPPRIGLRLLRWFCDPELLEDVEGDLLEVYDSRSKKHPKKANWLFILDVLFLFRPGIIKNMEGTQHLNQLGMIKNYLKTTWRNLLKHQRLTLINVLSLALGMAASLIIFLFINQEQAFDSIHQENLYRLCEVQSFPGTNTQKVALSMPGMGPTMSEEFPEVLNYTRLWNLNDQLVEKGDKRLIFERVVGGDSTFFQLFDFPLLHGDRNTLLDHPFDAVISESACLKIFGTKEVIGESFTIDRDQYIVRGVMADIRETSHLQFDMMLSISSIRPDMEAFNSEFGSNYLNTYLLLNPAASVAELEEKFPDYMVREADGDVSILDYYQLYVQPLNEVHLKSSDIQHDYKNYRKFNGKYLDVFALVGLFILIIATVNFMNLTTARARNRAKEVGVRKSIGAARSQLIVQFLIESILLSFIALICAFIIDLAGLPFLNELIGRELSLAPLLKNWSWIAGLIGITLFLGILAGLYPAFVLSSFKTLNVLKGLIHLRKRSVTRSSLILVQFSLAIGMIVTTIVVIQQLGFMKNKDLGFTKDHILLVDMNEQLQQNYTEVRDELLKKTSIKGVTASGQRLGNNFHQWGFKYRSDSGVVDITPSNLIVDPSYIDVYGIKLIKGRNFDRNMSSDKGNTYLINESMANALGFEDPVGKKAGYGFNNNDSLGTIIGVVEDFNFNSLHHEVNTLVLGYRDDWGYSEMSIKLDEKNIRQGVDDVTSVYEQFVTRYPIQFSFLDQHVEDLYQTDNQLGSVVSIMAILSIFIGCLGLFGLASISIQNRTKEVGIRKVLGASTFQLWYLLSTNFTVLIGVSFLIAAPLAYWFLSGWLENFAFRIDMPYLVFVLGGIVALLIGILTISYHVLKVAKSNPVNALRYE